MMQPAFSGAAVRISEDEDFKFRRELLDGHAQVVHFFSGTRGTSGDKYMRFHARGLGDAFNDAARRIGAGSENEENFVVLAVKFRQGDEVAFKAGFDAFAGTKQGDTRRVETGIGVQPPSHVAEPLQGMPDEVRSHQELQ